MVKLRLARAGGKRYPVYRIVATDSRSPRDGRFIEAIGQYNPNSSPKVLTFNDDRLDYWLGKGAQPSETLGKLILKYRREQGASA